MSPTEYMYDNQDAVNFTVKPKERIPVTIYTEIKKNNIFYESLKSVRWNEIVWENSKCYLKHKQLTQMKRQS